MNRRDCDRSGSLAKTEGLKAPRYLANHNHTLMFSLGLGLVLAPYWFGANSQAQLNSNQISTKLSQRTRFARLGRLADVAPNLLRDHLSALQEL